MKLQAGLSFDQAPPLLVPFRFFLSAPLFGAAAAVLLLWQGPDMLDSRWQPAALAATHLITLGFLGLTMLGALMQMLPVVAGAPVARPVGVARTVHGLMLFGILALAGGLLQSDPLWMRAAVVLLGGGLAVFMLAAALSLRRAVRNPTSTAMRYALLALLLATTLGLLLASNHGWGWWLQQRELIANLHLAWGLLGWVGLLVTGIAYQVVPMFQVTPAYPKWLSHTLVPALFALLLLWSALAGGSWPALPAGLGLALLFGLFAVTTLRLQAQRKRKVADVTLNFWRFGMGCLLLALAAWIWLQLAGGAGRLAVLPLLLFAVGFAVSVVNGMLYKIVPFLIWFHLQSRTSNILALPNMKEIIPIQRMRAQLWLHMAATLLLALSVLLPPLLYPAASLLAVSMLWLEAALLAAFLRYRRLERELA